MFSSDIASRGSFKRQIVLTFVVGFFCIATVFALYIVESEKAGLYRENRDATIGLTQSLAVSSRSWVLAKDVIGLQEVVHAFRDYPELRYAMVISPTGRVLAHSDDTKLGQFVADLQSVELIKAQPAIRVIREDPRIVDIAVPISIGNQHVGWARIALGRDAISGNLNKMIFNVALFVLFSSVLSFLAAMFVVNRLGRRIGSLVSVANEVQSGNFAMRVPQISGKADEISGLENSLNLMLDAMAGNEKQLRAASLYTRSLIEASLDPLVTISKEGKITDVNLATENITGRTRQELIGTDFSNYFTDPEKAREGYRQVFQNGTVVDYPLALRHRDGHITFVLYNASVYRNETGEVQGVFAAARDISEQQRAVLLRAQLAAIVESSSDAIIGKSLDGIITSWNKGAEKIYGYVSGEIVGKHITTLAPAARHDEVFALLETVRNGGTVANFQTLRLRKDGTPIDVALTLSPICDASGKVSGIATIARDISEQKNMEKERSENLRYYESMDKVNRAMQGAKDLEEMLSDVLGVVLDIFDCDRAGLVYPCDPQSPTWQIVMERSKPGYGTESRRGPLPMTQIRAESLQMLLDTNGPVQFTPEDDPAGERLETFGIRSFLSIAVHPRIGGAWEFGIHQCSHARTWNTQEVRLFEEIGRRLADGLNIMLVYRNLQESEHRYRLVFENSPISIWEEDFSGVKALLDGLKLQGVTDLEGHIKRHPEVTQQCAQMVKIVDVNAAALVLHGAQSKEELLAGLIDTFTPESFETFQQELVCLWNGGTQMMRDAVVKRLNGDLRKVTVYFLVCTGYEETFGKIIVSLVDITERKLAEELIRESETKYRSLIQNIQAAVVVHGADTQILVSNSMAQEILGLSEDQLAGKTSIDPAWHFFREDGKIATLDEYPVNRVLASRQPLRNFVLGVHRPDKDKDVWALASADPVLGKDGEITQVIVTFIDITERKQMEESLKRMNERFSLASHAASLGVWDWNLQKNELLWDDGMYELYGVKRGDFAGAYEAWLQGIHPDDRALSDEVSKQAQRGEREYDTEFRVVWPDGSTHHLKAYGQFVRDEKGNPLRMTGINFDITQLKLAEEELRTSERRYRLAQNIGHVGNWEYNIKTAEFWGSDEAKRIYGLDPAQPGFSTDEVEKFIPERERVHQALVDLIEKGIPYDLEFEIHPRNLSGVRIISSKADLKRDKDGNPEVVMGVIQDITDRKRTMEALQRSEQSLTEAQRIAHLGSWHMDLATNEVFWSEELYKIYGFDPALPPPLYTESMKLFTPESWEKLSNAIARAAESGIPYELELETVSKDGVRGWMLARGEQVIDERGAAVGVRGVVMDITVRKQAASALVQSEYMYRTLAENSPDVIVRYDRAGRRIYVNPEFERVNHLTAQQVLGKTPAELSTELKPKASEFTEKLMAAMASGSPAIVDLSWVKDGKQNCWYVRVVPEFDTSGNVVSALTIWSDITDRKQAEEEIRSLNRELEQRVAARTVDLEAANRELEAFSYSVSHDLRSPLRAIDGFSHILLEDYADKLDEEGKRLLGVVKGNANRMGQLIDDILKFSRSGRTEINATEIDMAKLAREVLEDLRTGVAQDSNLQFEIGSLPPASGDHSMMRQVFVNLLSNAIKFSRTREAPRVEVGGSIEGAEAVYYVKDNGVGFDMNYADKLFGVFERLHRVEEFEGTGIGLAIVKRIINRHGGRVWAEGKINEGATLYFTLPCSWKMELGS